MKTRDELKALILSLETVSIDGVIDLQCPWCGRSCDYDKTPEHASDCPWLELKNEPA